MDDLREENPTNHRLRKLGYYALGVAIGLMFLGVIQRVKQASMPQNQPAQTTGAPQSAQPADGTTSPNPESAGG